MQLLQNPQENDTWSDYQMRLHLAKQSKRELLTLYTAKSLVAIKANSQVSACCNTFVGLREQILSLVDDQKQRVLDQVSNILNPDAWHTGDDNPIQQVISHCL